MTTQLASIQDFAARDAEDVKMKLKIRAGKVIEGSPSSRDWVLSFSIHKVEKGLLEKPFSGKVRVNFPPAVARVDFGRWVAECPFCGGTCMVDPDDPFFFCLFCAGNGTGDASQCVFPDETERSDVEAELMKRKVITRGKFRSKADQFKNSPPLYHGLARNWNPGETVENLRKERLDTEAAYTGGQG